MRMVNGFAELGLWVSMSSTGKRVFDQEVGMRKMLERIFHLKAAGTTPGREVLAGLTTFAAMSYILAVNPAILSQTGLDVAGLVTATALAAFLGTILMAFLTNYPIAVAPGMGLNAFFAFTIVIAMGLPWEAALGLVFWNGILFLLLSLSGIRGKIAEAIPDALKLGIQCGIGLFIFFIGLQNGGLIEENSTTMLQMGDWNQPEPWLVLLGLIFMATWQIRKIPGAILGGILVLTIVGLWIPSGDGYLTSRPEAWISLPAGIGETFAQLDIWYVFQHWKEAYPIVVALLLVDMFDTIGTLIGVSRRANLLDKDGKLPKIGRALVADATATIGGAILGTSTTTSYIESAAGVETGGRTGLTSLVVALLFLLALFFTPIILVIPAAATAPALLLVGILMSTGLKQMNYEDLTEFIPAAVTLLFMPLTFSISHGIAFGFITYVLLKVTTGRRREVSWLVYLLAGIFLIDLLFFKTSG